MPSVVFCDNSDCRLHDDCYGQCDAEKLVVRRGVCAGSTVLGRNVSENDLDEQLRVENEKLKIENKRLTRELEAEHALAECLGHSHEVAKSENEKLRKLVRDMWWTMVKAAWDAEQPSLTEIRERIDDAGVEVE